MNFSASLRLRTAEFKRGLNSVNKMLGGLQRSFLNLSSALGLGLGFSKFISEAKKTATELSIVNATLENASKITNEYGVTINNYASNLEYVRGIAKKYNQDIISLTNGFAQFTAAANSTKDANGKVSLSLEEQKYIYEQLTRAAAGYHMSADRTNDMMNAVVQMISKGKVYAEELRRQLGNALPGAFGIMAAAIGVSTAELEDMMKKGQLLSSEALPKFAKMLEGITESMNFDSLQNSMNELKNQWTLLIDKMEVSTTMQKITDTVTSALSLIQENFREFKQWVASIFAGIGTIIATTFAKSKIANLTNGWKEEFNYLYKQTQLLGNKIRLFNNKGIAVNEGMGGYIESLQFPAGVTTITKDFVRIYDDATKAALEYNNVLIKIDNLQKKLGEIRYFDDDTIRKIKEANNYIKDSSFQVRNLIDETSTGVKVSNFFKGVWFDIKNIIASIGPTLIFSAVIGLITKIATKAKQSREEVERINSILPNFEKRMDNVRKSTSATAQNLQRTVYDLKKFDIGSLEYASGLAEINEALGLIGDKAFTIKSAYADIVGEVDKWVEKQRMLAIIGRATEEEQEAIKNKNKVEDELKKAYDQFYNEHGYMAQGVINPDGTFKKGATDKQKKDIYKFEYNGIKNGLLALIAENKILQQVIWRAQDEIANTKEGLARKYGVDLNGKDLNGGKETKPTETKGDTPESVMADYKKELKKLDNQLKNGALTEEEFNEKVEELKISTYQTIAAFEEWDEVLKKLGKDTITEANTLKAEYEQIIEKRKKEKEEAKHAADEKKAKEAKDNQSKKLDNYKLPKEAQRDTTFDYNKTQKDIDKEVAGIKSDRAKDIERIISNFEEAIESGDFDLVKDEALEKLKELKEALMEAKKEADGLQKKIILSEQIDKLSEQTMNFKSNKISNLQNLAEAFDRLNNSLMSIGKVFDEDITNSNLYKSYEAFTGVINHVIQVLEALRTMNQIIQTIQDLTAKKKALAAAQEVAANKLVTDSEIEKATAAAGSAAASSASAMAGIPFIGPALAITAVAGVVAAIMAGMSKFANGGIVGGNSYTGDKQIARVNSGEMILNKAQQGHLWSAIQNGGSGGKVEFKIKGDALVGALENYTRLRK